MLVLLCRGVFFTQSEPQKGEKYLFIIHNGFGHLSVAQKMYKTGCHEGSCLESRDRLMWVTATRSSNEIFVLKS